MSLSLKRKWHFIAILIVACILIIQFLFIKNKPWVSDYWEHKAVFLEFYRHPVNPDHPVVNVKAQHPFFSPYVLAFVITGRLLSISPELLLDFASFFNVFFFLCSVFLLERLVVKGKNQPKSFVLLLLTILFLWGAFPPYFSSFYHFVGLFYTGVYPATFAFCLSVLSGFLHNKVVNNRWWHSSRIVVIFSFIVFNWIILLTHPLTFIFSFSLFIYNYIEYYQLNSKSETQKPIFYILLELLLLFGVPVLLTFFWTYYSMWNLFLVRSSYGRFHLDSMLLYTGLWKGYYTLLLPVVLLFYCLVIRDKQAVAISIIIGGLFLVYLFGAITGFFGYGRTISFITLWIHLWLVSFLTKQVTNWAKKQIVVLLFLSALPFVYISVKSVYKAASTTNGDYLARMIESNFIANASIPEITHRLFLFKNCIDDGSIVMTDLVTSRYVAAFGAKAVASPYSEYWIEDNEERMNDINRFFNSTDSATQMQLLYKYKPHYLLLNPDENDIKRILPSSMIRDKIISINGYILIPLSFQE